MKSRKPKTGKLIAMQDSATTKRQHVKPCSDCPFRRDALSGWLGGGTAVGFVRESQGEGRMECHTKRSSPGNQWECAGAAVFRENICKSPRDKTLLVLARDAVNVFARPDEFITHHEGC